MAFGMIGKKKKKQRQAREAAEREQARQTEHQKGIDSIGQIFSQFNDGFFDKRRQSYMDYASPQINKQYQDAQQDLAFSLARSGLSDSSVRGSLTGDLQRQYDLANQSAADQAMAYAQQARNQIEGARSDANAMLNASGDVKSATDNALARAQAASAQPNFSPIANLFSDFAQGLQQRQAWDQMNRFMGGGGSQPRWQGQSVPRKTMWVR